MTNGWERGRSRDIMDYDRRIYMWENVERGYEDESKCIWSSLTGKCLLLPNKI